MRLLRRDPAIGVACTRLLLRAGATWFRVQRHSRFPSEGRGTSNLSRRSERTREGSAKDVKGYLFVYNTFVLPQKSSRVHKNTKKKFKNVTCRHVTSYKYKGDEKEERKNTNRVVVNNIACWERQLQHPILRGRPRLQNSRLSNIDF